MNEMNEPPVGGPQDDGPQRDQPQEQPQPHDVGSVGEEAVKLFGALADLARQHAGDAGGTFSGLAGQAAAMAHEVNEHLATDSPECTYCPVCRVVHVVRETSPEVKAHLMVAASSLMQAAAGLMETLPPPTGTGASARGPAVERIDLDEADDAGDESDHNDPGANP
ncbi:MULTISPECIES: hypothetical protein [Nocardioides]|uniref:Uncharacterized protein n=1 Tax=Nocardioides vastitatis TaxID=2568655 RepID=A0ABW0ZEA5_9ACTN|nr:hypothetical protein [Nocardioides sp.]THJ11337.1 hypothetical protein E7Z54_02425 [Nocardioides sp.]